MSTRIFRTGRHTRTPAQAGVQSRPLSWTPACAVVRFGVISALIATVSACNSQSPSAAARAATAREDQIACQPAGAESLEAVCRVDRAVDERGLVLTLHHPDGSFRRLLVTHDGRGVVAADGAEQARVKLADTIGSGSEIEVSLAGNRYILPATVQQ